MQNWNFLGPQNWDTQRAWADNLVFAGSSDWRLPSFDEYFDLNVDKGSVMVAGGFVNVRLDDFYWSTTELANGRVLLFEPSSRSGPPLAR